MALNFFNKIFNKNTEVMNETKSSTITSSIETNVPLSDSAARAFLTTPYTNAGRFSWSDVQAYAAWQYYKKVACIRDAVDTGSNNFLTVPFAIKDLSNDELITEYDSNVPASMILNLLKNPNQDKTESDLKRQFYSSYYVTGDLYVLTTSSEEDSEPLEMFFINPQNVSSTTNSAYTVMSYSINNGEHRDKYYREELDDDRVIYVNKEQDRQLWHIKTFSPNDTTGDPTGLSPLSSLYFEMEQLIGVSLNNNAILRNGMRPSLAMTVHKPDQDFSGLTPDQINNIKQSTMSHYAGPNNAGNVMVLDGISQVTELAIKNKDMQFLEMFKEMSMQVYRNMNMPLPMVNQNSQTYNNYAESKLSFYDMNIIPFATILAEELNRFLMPRVDDTGRYELVVNKEEIPVIKELRKEKESELKTLNERRADIGLDPIDDDYITIGNSAIPLNDMGQEEDITDRTKFIERLMDRGIPQSEAEQKAHSIYGCH